MKTLIAAVVATVVSFGAFAQTNPAASAPMAKPTASDTAAKKSSTSTHKSTSTSSKKHHSSTSKKASAPAA
jgi:hypothetical protein